MHDVDKMRTRADGNIPMIHNHQVRQLITSLTKQLEMCFDVVLLLTNPWKLNANGHYLLFQAVPLCSKMFRIQFRYFLLFLVQFHVLLQQFYFGAGDISRAPIRD
jgi:hypothetical protein